MASHIDTIPPKTTTPEPHPPPKARGVLTWAIVTGASVAVAALAVVTLTGVDDDSDMPTPRFDPQAEQIERQAHLEGQARTYGPDGGSTPPSEPSNGAAQEAQAEKLERQAHLEGQARTYGPDGGSTPPSEPSNGAAQEAQAEKLERQAHLDGLAWTYGRHPTP